MLSCAGGSDAPHDPPEGADAPEAPPHAFVPLAGDLQVRILENLPARSIVAFGSTARFAREASREALDLIRDRFAASAPDVDATSPEVLTRIHDWLAVHRGARIDVTDPATFAAVAAVQQVAAEYVRDRQLDHADLAAASGIVRRLHDLFDDAGVAARSAGPMGQLLATNLAIAGELRHSPGGPDQAECDRMVTRMTSIAAKHGGDAAVALLHQAVSYQHTQHGTPARAMERRLHPQRFLAEALFQFRPPSSTATNLDAYLANDLRFVRPVVVAPRPTAHAPTVEALLMTAHRGTLKYSDATTDWTPQVIASHGVPLRSLPELARLHRMHSSETAHVPDAF